MSDFRSDLKDRLVLAAEVLLRSPDPRPDGPVEIQTSAGSEPGSKRQRRTYLRVIAGALGISLLIAAAALAAAGLLNGAPVELPRGIPLQPRSGLGVPSPTSPTAIVLQTADPAGGPAWGARFITTTRGYGCLQFGRVDGDALGVIGQDGAFSNDGRFHALPVDYLEGPFPCAPLDAHGHAFSGVFMDGTPASGQVAEDTCTASGGLTHATQPPCPAGDERLVMAGMAGPLARTIDYRAANGRLHTVATAGEQGVYLIVLRAPAHIGREAGEYQPGGPGVGTIRRITYANGEVCFPQRSAPGCTPVGEAHLADPGLSAASVASPVSVRLQKRAVKLRYRTVVLPMFVVSFRARIPVTSGASGYSIWVRCRNIGEGGPVFSDVDRGQVITRALARNGCRGTARIRVAFQNSGRTAGLPFDLKGSGLTVGERVIHVP